MRRVEIEATVKIGRWWKILTVRLEVQAGRAPDGSAVTFACEGIFCVQATKIRYLLVWNIGLFDGRAIRICVFAIVSIT